MTAPSTAVPVTTRTVTNLRDLGGIALPGAGPGHVVRKGLLLRSGQLNLLDQEADPAFAKLGPRTVVDLRTEAERHAAPDRVPSGARLVVADVLADNVAATPARLHGLLDDPDAADSALADVSIERAYTAVYRRLVLSPAACTAYRTLVLTAAEAADRPVLFHCTAGKDRTGWGATLLLLLLGADRPTVRAEYVAVNPAVRAAFAPYVDAFVREGGSPRTASALVEVRPAYLESAIAAMDERWGDVETYVRDGLRVPRHAIDTMRDGLITQATDTVG